MVDRSKDKLPGFLERINKNVQESIEATGFAATSAFSLADVCLLNFLHTVVFNENVKEYGAE